jgi:hypothetical protein
MSSQITTHHSLLIYFKCVTNVAPGSLRTHVEIIVKDLGVALHPFLLA